MRAVPDQPTGRQAPNPRQVRATRISISLPPELHDQLQALSAQQQRSLSNLCALLLAQAVQRTKA